MKKAKVENGGIESPDEEAQEGDEDGQGGTEKGNILLGNKVVKGDQIVGIRPGDCQFGSRRIGHDPGASSSVSGHNC